VPVDLGMYPYRVILDDNASELDALHWHIHVVILLMIISIMMEKVNALFILIIWTISITRMVIKARKKM
jgi:hypothetical protein